MSWAARSVVPIVASISKVITMTALRQQMENDMVLRGMAVRTRQSYIEAVRGSGSSAGSMACDTPSPPIS